jgi:hypothetical protein
MSYDRGVFLREDRPGHFVVGDYSRARDLNLSFPGDDERVFRETSSLREAILFASGLSSEGPHEALSVVLMPSSLEEHEALMDGREWWRLGLPEFPYPNDAMSEGSSFLIYIFPALRAGINFFRPGANLFGRRAPKARGGTFDKYRMAGYFEISSNLF